MKDCTVIVFSKNRAMQADLCLKSLALQCSGLFESADVNVLWTADPNHLESYAILMKEHPSVNWVKEENFKNDLLNLVKNKKFVLFSVDDTVWVQKFELSRCKKLLDLYPSAIGMSLRLGNTCEFCYTMNQPQKLPEVIHRIGTGDVCIYDWTKAELDFNYPIELSASLYRLEDILTILEKGSYTHPNLLEAIMNIVAQQIAHTDNVKHDLLMFNLSRSFSIPLNMVQTAWKNRAGNKYIYHSYNLMQMFMDGVRVDEQKFNGYIPQSCHEEVDLF